MRVRYIKRVSYVISGWIGVSIPAMRVRYIAKITSNSKAVSSFNSRYAGKIHQSMYPKGALCYTVSIPAMRVRYIPFLLYSFSCIHRFNSRYAGKIHQQKQRKTLPLTMASLCKTPFLLFIVYHICLHLSTFYPNFTDFVLIFRRRLVRVSSFSSRFYSGFSGSRTWPVPVPAQNAKDS